MFLNRGVLRILLISNDFQMITIFLENMIRIIDYYIDYYDKKSGQIGTDYLESVAFIDIMWLMCIIISKLSL